MNQDPIKLIGRKQDAREDSLLVSLSDIEGLIHIFGDDFKVWSDFDSWENINFQRWVFERAMDLLKGRKIDLRCDCCTYTYVLQRDFKRNLDQKCYGIKTGYMIEKIVDEIILAKARRDSDGTYSA
tara:strand:- start:237 stop:614 length:378 start_codon:yes stop_codon:yes gene_type:complete